MPVHRSGARTEIASIRPRNVDIKFLDRRAQTPDDLARPERFTQDRYPAVLWFADSTKRVATIGLLVGIQPVPGKVAFESGICRLRGAACANAKRFTPEALKQLLQLFCAWRRNHEATFRRLPPFDLPGFAEFPNTVEVAEKINRILFFCRQRRKNLRPNLRGFASAHRLAVFRFHQL